MLTIQAQKVRGLIAQDFARVFELVDAVIAPGLGPSRLPAW